MGVSGTLHTLFNTFYYKWGALGTLEGIMGFSINYGNMYNV